MRVLFNDHEPYAAAWLRNLYPEAEIDERDIAELTAKDLKGYERVHLFAGIGGWEHALDLGNIRLPQHALRTHDDTVANAAFDVSGTFGLLTAPYRGHMFDPRIKQGSDIMSVPPAGGTLCGTVSTV